ncbi:MAG: response regulator transcription factor [Saprospiraceae bacterium]|nr:response regulator transcription factor [Saprospiraceae bacterium]
MKLKCLVIDDDPMICDLVKHFCSKLEEIEYCLSANTGNDGLQVLSQQKFDVLLLDYHLPDMTGQSILEIRSQNIPVIMITSEKDFAALAFDYDEIVDFLVKPLHFDRFKKAINRVHHGDSNSKSILQDDNDICYIKDGNKYVKVNYNDIHFLRSEENYVAFVLHDKTILSLIPLKNVEALLPSHFKRVHRSFIVNLNKVEKTTLEEITIGSRQIPISQKYKKEFFEILNNKLL